VEHERLAIQLQNAGFRIRRIVRQEIHPVWQAHLNRGTIPRGSEDQSVRQLICAFLRGYGVRYPMKEVTVVVSGDRVQASFIFEKGRAGSLNLYGGKQEWDAGYIY